MFFKNFKVHKLFSKGFGFINYFCRYVSALQFSELTGGGATDDLYMRISAIGHPKFDRQEQDGRTRYFLEVCTY